VSFPGGHIDLEETPETAALREANEEIGLDEVKVLGRFHACRAVTGTMVYPVVGLIEQPSEFESLDQVRAMANAGSEDGGEVEQVFSASLSELTDPRNIEYEDLGARYTRNPRFQVGDNPVIWGLTAFILHGFLKEVVVPTIVMAEDIPPATFTQGEQDVDESASASKM
jgi:8-oxo-dGTP pyrophosphatase MutT (NUDIX family)